MFLALVDKENVSMRLYSLAPIWVLYHDHVHCPDPAAIHLIPRRDGSKTDPVGRPVQSGKVSSSPR